MDPNNPYAAPQVALIDDSAPQSLAGWSPGQLYILGWLSLASIVCTLMSLFAAYLAGDQSGTVTEKAGDWLSLMATVLGCYLLVRLRAFLQERFAATGLGVPIGLSIVFSLIAEGLGWLWGDALFTHMDWHTLAFFAVIVLLGLVTLWLGIALLRVRNAYPAVRLMAWLEVFGGILCASIILVLLAIIPLLGGSLAMAWVFFRGANELKGLQSA